MIDRKGPIAEANRLSQILSLTLAGDRFPVDVESLAIEYSKNCFPGSPITKVIGDHLPGFEGMLKANQAKSKWIIVYNSSIRSKGRIRFTMAHELGHYLLHRARREQFQCSQLDMEDWDSETRGIESEADVFASFLLMPLDDFRLQLGSAPMSFDLLSHCANRYGVSLTASALKWIEIAPKRALVIATRDDFVLWARPNTAALKSGVYLPTRRRTIEVPRASGCHSSNAGENPKVGIVPANIWFPKEPADMPLTEMCLVSEYYDYTLSLLLMPDAEPRFQRQDEEDELLTPVDVVMRYSNR